MNMNWKVRVATAILLCSVPAIQAAGPVQQGPAQHGVVHEPAYREVVRTVRVPEVVEEKRLVNSVKYVPEIRERQVIVSRRIPETHQVTRKYTVLVPQKEVRTETYHVRKPIWSEVEQTYTVMLPHRETRQGTRRICRTVPVKETRTVTRYLEGSLQKGAAQASQKAEMVTEEVPVTVYKQEIVEEPYDYTVVVCRPEQRTRTVRVCDYVTEERTRDVTYMRRVPEVREKLCDVTHYKLVTEEKTQQYRVLVPQTVQKEVTVRVCHMVEKQIVTKVPVCVVPACDCCY